MISKFWKDPVWSKVIAYVICTVGGSVALYFLNKRLAISTLVKRCYGFALASTSIPNWILFVLGIIVLLAVIFLGAIVWQKVLQSARPWLNYTTDIFFGLRWRWEYSKDGQIYNTHTFCPYCDLQVNFHNATDLGNDNDYIVFHCENCDHHLGEFQGSFDLFKDKTIRNIQLKIRNGTWLNQNSLTL